MKTLERYILREFLKLLALTMTGFVFVFIVVDLFENMDHIVKNDVPFLEVTAFFAYKIPFIIGQVCPVAVLLSVLISLGILSKNGEITAVKASGVKLLKVFLPIFAAGLFISAAVIFINEYATPEGLKRAEAFRRVWFSEIKPGSFGSEGVWIRTEREILNIKDVDLKKNTLYGLTVYRIEKPFRPMRRVHSRELKWDGERWVADSATVWDFTGETVVKETVEESVVLTALAPPEELSGVKDRLDVMSIGELGRYISNLEAEGYESHKYRTDLYSRFSFPVVNFIMVFLGIPFALRTGRSGGIAVGVGLSVVIGFSYWIVFATSRSLGTGGVVPPLIAAGFPDMLFLAVGALMLGYVRQ